MLSIDKYIVSSDLQDFFPSKLLRIYIEKVTHKTVLQEIGIFILKSSNL